MKSIEAYMYFVNKKMEEVKCSEMGNIDKAAALIAESCEKGGRLFVLGTGHSHIISEEIYVRAGGLAFVKAILMPELMLHEMPNKSTYIERLSGYAQVVFNLYKISELDTLLVVSNSGRNNVPVEMCLIAKEQGINVIALTSLKHAKATESRHISGKHIHEIADVVIDNHAEIGDASFLIPDFTIPMGATSDITGAAIAQAMMIRTAELLVTKGITPPVFMSSNLDGADEHNNKIMGEYF